MSTFRNSSNTLCNYSFQLPADGLRCSTDNGYTQTEAIELVVSQGTSPVYVQSITVQLPVGNDDAISLSESSNITVNATFPGGVQVTQLSPGKWEFLPQTGSYFTLGDSGGYILFSGIVMNAAVGVATIAVTESSTSTSTNAANNQYATTQGAYQIGKFPYRFYMRNFGADKASVGNGETTTLKWNAAQNGSYQLLWSDANGQQTQDVTNVRTWVSPPLYQDTTFVLQGRTINGGTRYMELTTTVMVANPDLVAKTLVIGTPPDGYSGGGFGGGGNNGGTGGDAPPTTTTVYAVENDGPETNVFRFGTNNPSVQTFVSAATGTLDSMQFYTPGTGKSPITVRLLLQDIGGKVSTIATASMTASGLDAGWTTVDFPSGGDVVEGSHYSIEFTFSDSSGWELGTNTEYTDGYLMGGPMSLLMRVALTQAVSQESEGVMLDNSKFQMSGVYLDQVLYQQVVPDKSFQATLLELFCYEFDFGGSNTDDVSVQVQIGTGTSSGDFVPVVTLPAFPMVPRQFTQGAIDYAFESGKNYLIAISPATAGAISLSINDNLQYGQMQNLSSALQFRVSGTAATSNTPDLPSPPALDVFGAARTASLQVTNADFSVGQSIEVAAADVVANKANASGGVGISSGQQLYQRFTPSTSFKGLQVQFLCQASEIPAGVPLTISVGKGTSSSDFQADFESPAITFTSANWCGTTFNYDFEAGQSYIVSLANSSDENVTIEYNAGQFPAGQLLGLTTGWNLMFSIDGVTSQASAALKVMASGNVGIGTLSPQYSLDVAGTIQATNVIQSSDRTLKENIATLPSALDQVARLRGVCYNRKGSRRAELGLIAQEVATVFPDLVHYDAAGVAGLAYTQLSAVFVEAIKALKAENDQLRADVEALKRRDVH